MFIYRLELHNFRVFDKLELYFPRGIIGLIGNNGAGKSTIFNSIDWILWGKYHGVSKLSELKRHGVSKNTPTYGVLDFAFNGDYYRIRRDLTNSPNKNYIIRNKVMVAQGTTNINAYISRLFKMNQETFRTIFYATQGDFDALAQMTDAPRAMLISKLLRIDAIDEAARKTREDARLLKAEIEQMQFYLKDENELLSALSAHQSELKKLLNKRKTVLVNLSNLEKIFESKKEEKKKLDSLYETYQNFDFQISNLETKIHTLQNHTLKNQKEQLNKLLNKKERLSQIQNQKDDYFRLLQEKDELNEKRNEYLAVKQLKKQLSELHETLSYHENNLKTTEEQLDSFSGIEEMLAKKEEDLKKVEASISLLKEKNAKIQTTIKFNKEQFDSIMNELSEIQKLGHDVPCPTCKRPLGEHLETLVANLNTKKEAILQNVTTLKSAAEKNSANLKKGQDILVSLQNEIAKLRKQATEKSALESQLKHSKAEKERVLSQISEANKQLQQFPENIDFDPERYEHINQAIQKIFPVYEEIVQLEKLVEEIPSAQNEIKRTEEEIKECKNTIQELIQKQEALGFDKDIYSGLNQEIDDILKKLDAEKDEKFLIETEIEKNRAAIEQIQNEIEKNKETKKTIEDKKTKVILFEKLSSLFKEYKTDKMAKLAPALSEVMSDMLSEITDYYDRVELDEKYNIFIYKQGEKYPLEIFSGGEQKLAALLQRIAVSQLVAQQNSQAPFEMIALDEVTSQFDETRQDATMEMLRELNKIFKQIMVVSHNEHVKDNFDHILYIERNGNISNAEWSPTFDIDELKEFVQDYFETEDIKAVGASH